MGHTSRRCIDTDAVLRPADEVATTQQITIQLIKYTKRVKDAHWSNR